MGHYLPADILTNEQLMLTVDTSDEWIVERTGIHGRRRAAPDEATSDLALHAAHAALADAGLTARDLDLILLATSTADAPVPTAACFLQAKLGCIGVPAMDIGAGCSGFGYALRWPERPSVRAACTSACWWWGRIASRGSQTTPTGSRAFSSATAPDAGGGKGRVP